MQKKKKKKKKKYSCLQKSRLAVTNGSEAQFSRSFQSVGNKRYNVDSR